VDAAVSPFAGDVAEIPLPAAPLAKVIAQIRYPRPLDFEGEESVDPIRRLLAGHYPVSRKVQGTAVVITPEGVAQQPSQDVNWTFQDVSEEWKITVSPQSISLEADKYTSRDDFCDRFNEAVSALAEVMHPPVYDRLGVRYVNILAGQDILAELPNFVEPVAQAGLVVPRGDVQVQHSLCDSLFIDGNAQLQVRWGWLPPGVGIDPTVTPPKVPYWLLDIDSFTGRGGPFEVGTLHELTRDLAMRAYRLFRWIVTDDFIAHFGGKHDHD
jgi:uncharacterized protein (TIGR04255 family)